MNNVGSDRGTYDYVNGCGYNL